MLPVPDFISIKIGWYLYNVTHSSGNDIVMRQDIGAKRSDP